MKSKEDLVLYYIYRYADEFGSFPDPLELQDEFYPIVIDEDLIKQQIEKAGMIIPWAYSQQELLS